MFWALLITYILMQRKKMDFTLRIYKKLLLTLLHKGYVFIRFEDYCSKSISELPERFIILRHDVDMKPRNSLQTAEIEHALGIGASYYFRVVKQSNNPEVIRAIVDMGHELGYHYEDLSTENGNMDLAIKRFEEHLQYFRRYYPVRTICMHGAPISKYDSKDMWKQHDYHRYGIIGEPYFDVDFSRVFYLTDTGRRWDGHKVSVRDKIPRYQEHWTQIGWTYASTQQIIHAIKHEQLPARIMLTTHPQRWNNNIYLWTFEYVMQAAKNVVKRIIIRQQ